MNSKSPAIIRFPARHWGKLLCATTLCFGAAPFLSASNLLLSENFGDDPGRDGDGGLTLSTGPDASANPAAGWFTTATSLRHIADNTGNPTFENQLAVTQIPSLGGGSNTDFEISLTFQWDQGAGSSTFRRIGVAFLGEADNGDLAAGDNYYAAVFFPLQGDHGQLRLLNSIEGGTVTSNVNRTSGSVEPETDYTISLSGTYNDDGDLAISFSVVDLEGGGGNVLSTTIAAASVFSGQYFGIAARTMGGESGGGDIVDFGNFTVIPEPSTYAALAGLLALGLVIVRRRAALRKK